MPGVHITRIASRNAKNHHRDVVWSAGLVEIGDRPRPKDKEGVTCYIVSISRQCLRVRSILKIPLFYLLLFLK